jgi:hypothetical protein
MKNKVIVLFFLFIIKCAGIFSQNFSCFDSTKIVFGAVCPPEYDPVCACNEKTFKNYCQAQNNGYQNFVSGICSPIDININRNPVYDNLTVDLRLKNTSDAELYIFDIYGNTYFSKHFSATEKETVFLNVLNFPRGLYLILALANNQDKMVLKFLKIDF